MKRSAGVTASAVAIMVGSLAFLLFAAIIFVASALQISQPGTPQFVRTGVVFTGLLMLGFSAWGIWTAVGLLKLRAWSRTSILVFSGLLVAFCGLAALMTNFAPFPPPRNAAPVPGGIRAGITIFYGLLALLGAGWLYFFNRAKTKAQFTSLSDGPPLAPSRPLSVTVIGGFLLFSAAMFLVLGVRPMPATFLGLLVTGLPGHLLYIGYGVLAILLGVGLLRLNPLARVVGIGYFVFQALNSVLFLALPGYEGRIHSSLAILPPELRPAQVSDYGRSMVTSMLFGILTFAAQIWFLVMARRAFLTEAGTPAAKSTGL